MMSDGGPYSKRIPSGKFPTTNTDDYAALQLEDHVEIKKPTETNTKEVRGLITPISINPNPENNNEITIFDETRTHDFNLAKQQCDCDSYHPTSLCKHVHHLQHRKDRGLLPQEIAENVDNPESIPEQNQPRAQHTLECENCGESIHTTKKIKQKSHTTICNICALETQNIAYLTQNQNETLCLIENVTETPVVDSYANGNTMKVYDFFKSNPNVQPNDATATIRTLITDSHTGFLAFTHATKQAPVSVLTSAKAKLEDNTQDNSQSNDTQPIKASSD